MVIFLSVFVASVSKSKESLNNTGLFLKSDAAMDNALLFKEEISSSKIIKEEDYITIRGKGRFRIKRIIGKTKSGRIALEIEK